MSNVFNTPKEEPVNSQVQKSDAVAPMAKTDTADRIGLLMTEGQEKVHRNNILLRDLFAKTNIADLEEKIERRRALRMLDQDEFKERYAAFANEIQENPHALETVVEDEMKRVTGLDGDSLRKREAAYREVIPDAENHYVPVIGMVHAICGEDLHGKTIVEIGPGTEGRGALGYFSAHGAHAIGIDPGILGTDDAFPSVEHVNGCWEDIEEIMNGRKADIIYIHHMHPHPEQGGEFEGEQEKFEKHVTEAMDKVLVPTGAFINHNVWIDFSLDSQDFERLGYNKYNFGGSCEGRTPDPMLLPRSYATNPQIEYSHQGTNLTVFQKSAGE